MPVQRVQISISQFCELLALEPGRLVGLDYDRASTVVTLVLEPDETGDPAPTRVKGK